MTLWISAKEIDKEAIAEKVDLWVERNQGCDVILFTDDGEFPLERAKQFPLGHLVNEREEYDEDTHVYDVVDLFKLKMLVWGMRKYNVCAVVDLLNIEPTSFSENLWQSVIESNYFVFGDGSWFEDDQRTKEDEGVSPHQNLHENWLYVSERSCIESVQKFLKKVSKAQSEIKKNKVTARINPTTRTGYEHIYEYIFGEFPRFLNKEFMKQEQLLVP